MMTEREYTEAGRCAIASLIEALDGNLPQSCIDLDADLRTIKRCVKVIEVILAAWLEGKKDAGTGVVDTNVVDEKPQNAASCRNCLQAPNCSHYSYHNAEINAAKCLYFAAIRKGDKQ